MISFCFLIPFHPIPEGKQIGRKTMEHDRIWTITYHWFSSQFEQNNENHYLHSLPQLKQNLRELISCETSSTQTETSKKKHV